MRKHLLTLAKLAVSAALIAWVMNGINFRDVIAKITGVSTSWFATAALFLVGALILGAVRWQLVLGALGVRPRFGVTARLFLVGIFFNQTLPSSIGGDATRVFYLWRTGTSAQTALNSVLLDRIIGLTVLMVATTIIAPSLTGHLDNPIAINGLVLVLIASWVAIAALFMFDNSLTRRFRNLRLIDVALKLSRDAVDLCRQPSLAAATLAISLAIHGATVATAWSLDHALGGDASLLIYIIAMTPTILLISIPISIAGWGVREQILVVLLGALGTSATQALSVSILFGTLLLIAGIPGGILWLSMRQSPKNEGTPEID